MRVCDVKGCGKHAYSSITFNAEGSSQPYYDPDFCHDHYQELRKAEDKILKAEKVNL